MYRKLAVMMLLPGLCGAALAKESDINCLCGDWGFTACASMGMYSSYISRGVLTDADPVLQNELRLAFKGLEFAYWTSMPASTGRDAADSNEIDLTASYGIESGNFAFRAGHITYNYLFSGGVTTREWFANAEVRSLPVGLCFTYFSDYDQFKGSYSTIDIDKEFTLDSRSLITLVPSLHCGIYGDYGTFKSGGDITAGLASSLKVLEHMSFEPSVSYSMPYGDVSDENIGNQKAAVYGGARMMYEF